ncbi:DNA-directed RNA polymerase subunit beta [Chlamydia trachomatis]|nr:DNA-directed RNA polymerase subunit beta [Chlamydia trachomatis]
MKKDKFLRKDKVQEQLDSLESIYRTIRKDDRITTEGLKNFIPALLFNERRYNLSKTGRYMLNRKLNLLDRIIQTYLAEDIFDSKGKLLYPLGTFITPKIANDIQSKFENSILPLSEIEGIDENVYGRQLEITKNENLNTRTKIITLRV